MICKIYHCKRTQGRCCTECGAEDCDNRCLNAPDRCRCSAEGEPRRQHQRGPVVDVERILMLGRRPGITYAEIAEDVGCSVASVQHHLARAGLRRHADKRGGGKHG